MLDADSRYIIRVMFKNKVLASDGQVFENLFTTVMVKNNKCFEQVKPYGNIGDRKNDGFIKNEGKYYQVYAPESIGKNNITINDAISKMNNDFQGLYKAWNSICPIKQFFFVINDKYKGAPPQLHSAMLELNKVYPNVGMEIITSNKLEDIFLSLDEDSVIDVVGGIPNPTLQLDFSALTEVLNYLMNTKESFDRSEDLIVPDFDKKIIYNKLSQRIAYDLRSASYQVGNLEHFFHNNSEFTKNDIQKKVSECYVNATKSIPIDDENYSDCVFMKMIDDICPNKTQAIKNAALVLAAYYFESCDIFEKPKMEMD